MLRFKTFLLEYITDKQRDRYKDIHMTDKARADTDHFFGSGNDVVHGSIHNNDKSEIHNQLEHHLGQEISHDDYKRGMVKDKHGRDVKIGRLIKDNDLRNQFDKDPARQLDASHHTIKTKTVRGIEVAGQTNPATNAEHPKGHSWAEISCKNVDTGINRHYLKDEIKHGTVVHFVHDHNGQEIYRATLHPHHNENNHTAYSVDAEYGVKHPDFTRDANRIATHLSGEYKPGLYKKHPDVYNDSGVEHVVHPKTPEDEIRKHINTGIASNILAVMNHPNFKGDMLHDLVNHSNVTVREKALKHVELPREHLEKALKHDHIETRLNAVSNPNLTSSDLHHVLSNDISWKVRARALEHPRVNASHITKALEDDDSEIREKAVKHRRATPQHLEKAIDDESSYVRHAALESPNVTSKHIDKWVNHSRESIRDRAIKHNKASDETLARVVGGSDHSLAHTALENPNIKPAHLDIALNSESGAVRRAAVRHPLATVEQLHKVLDRHESPRERELVFGGEFSHYDQARTGVITSDTIDKGLSDPSPEVRTAAAKHPKAEPHHIMKALDDPHLGVARSAMSGRGQQSHDTIMKAIQHPDRLTRNGALWHGDATPEHYKHVAQHDPDEQNRQDAQMFIDRGRWSY